MNAIATTTAADNDSKQGDLPIAHQPLVVYCLPRHLQSHDRLLSLNEAAFTLGCSAKTLLRRIQDGSLPNTRLGRRYRFRAQDLAALVTNNG